MARSVPCARTGRTAASSQPRTPETASSQPKTPDALAALKPRRKKFERWLAILKETHPASLPVVVKRTEIRLKDAPWAYTYKGKRKGKPCFVVTVDRRIPDAMAWIFLIHEWAHCLAWDDHGDYPDHSDAWGLAHALLWREHVQDGDHED